MVIFNEWDVLWSVFFLLFMYEKTLSWICFRGIDIFVIFIWINSRKSATFLFAPTATDIYSEIIYYLEQA